MASILVGKGVLGARLKMIKTKGKITPAFIAGFLDGDGSIGCYYCADGSGRRYLTPIIELANNDFMTMLKIEQIMPRGNFITWIHKNQKHAISYKLVFRGNKRVKEVLNFLQGNYFSSYRRHQLRSVFQRLGYCFKFSDELSIDWVRGFMAAEGCSSWQKYINKTGALINIYKRYGMSQKNRELLDKINFFLRKKNIESSIHKDRLYYQLYINARDVAKFESFFGVLTT